MDEQEASAESSGLSRGETPRAAVAGGSGADPAPYGIVNQSDAPGCPDCGTIMIRSGTCYKCPNCGVTSGCS
jgi:ribonucleoside-diphosphate reductase alpha chain